MACVAPESADPRRGLSEISNLDGFSSAANDGKRRFSTVAPRPREGPLTEATAGTQPRPQERVLMPPNRSLATPPGIESVGSRRANARMRSASSFEATVRLECDMRRATRDLAVAAGGRGRTGCTPPARSSAECRQYLLRHALELAFLVISNDPEQD